MAIPEVKKSITKKTKVVIDKDLPVTLQRVTDTANKLHFIEWIRGKRLEQRRQLRLRREGAWARRRPAELGLAAGRAGVVPAGVRRGLGAAAAAGHAAVPLPPVAGGVEPADDVARPRRRFHLRQAAVHHHPSQAPEITPALGQAVSGVFSVTFPDLGRLSNLPVMTTPARPAVAPIDVAKLRARRSDQMAVVV